MTALAFLVCLVPFPDFVSWASRQEPYSFQFEPAPDGDFLVGHEWPREDPICEPAGEEV